MKYLVSVGVGTAWLGGGRFLRALVSRRPQNYQAARRVNESLPRSALPFPAAHGASVMPALCSPWVLASLGSRATGRVA